MPSNQAAWLTAAKANPLKVAEAPYTSPGPNEIVIKNAAIAINPIDWKIQDYGVIIEKFPSIVGEDLAGTVEEVGAKVKTIKKGDRVLAYV